MIQFDPVEYLKRPLLSYRSAEPVPSVVYVMRCEQHIKIGISTDISKRLAGLQGANPFKVTLATKFDFTDKQYAWLAEQTCHTAFGDFRGYGEWFNLAYDEAAPTIRQIVHATRKLMIIHRRVEREAEEARRLRYETDEKFRAKRDAEYRDAKRRWQETQEENDAAERAKWEVIRQRRVA
jgi:hypothetical protein